MLLLVFFILQIFVQLSPALRFQPITPYYFVCPGIPNNATGTKNQVKLGIMLSLPSTSDIEEAGINISSYDLIPGELIVPTSNIAVSAMEQAEIINTEGIILPDHHLCLYFTFVPLYINDITSFGSNYLYTHSKTYQTINALDDMYLFQVHRDLMVSYGNMVNIASPMSMFECPKSPNALDALFSANSTEINDEGCEPGLFKTNLNIQLSSLQLVKAAKLLIEELGWKKFGIITTCSHQEIWQNEDRGIFLSYYKNDFEQTFKILKDNEIKVFLFVGTACSYFDLLIQAYDRGVSTSE